MLLAPLAVNDALLPEIATVVGMLVLEVYLLLMIVPRGGEVPTVARFVLVATALIGSAGVLLAFLWVVLYPNLNSETILFETFGVTMGFPVGLWMICIVVYRDRRLTPSDWSGPVLVAGLATGGELLMGLLFVLASGVSLDALGLAAATVTSPWYVVSMGAAMIALLLWVPSSRGVRLTLFGLAISGLLAPVVADLPIVGAVLSTAVMGLTLAALGLGWRRGDRTALSSPGFLLAAFGGFLAMSLGGLAVAVAQASPMALLAYGAVSSAVMAVELTYVLRRGFLHLRVPESLGDQPTPRSTAVPGAAP